MNAATITETAVLPIRAKCLGQPQDDGTRVDCPIDFTALDAEPRAICPECNEPVGAMDHQRHAAALAADTNALLLGHEMGTGKTLTTIGILEQRQAMRVLVICPKSVVAVWPDQLAQHATRTWHTWAGEVRGARGPLANPSVARRCEALIQANTAALRIDRPFMAVVNYEASHLGQMAQLLVGTDWDAVILDESHRIKSPSGKASKLAARVTARCRDRGGQVLGLTGTPFPHSPLDIFGQMRALDGGKRFGTNYHHFQKYYGAAEHVHVARNTPLGPYVHLDEKTGAKMRTVYVGIRPDRDHEFARRLSSILDRVAADDVLDLPEVMPDVYRTFQLTGPARKAYDELESDLITKVDQGVITAANAMVLVMRLAQTTSGFGVDAITGEPIQLSDERPDKAKALKDVLTDIPQGEPVVVFARFHMDLDNIAQVAQECGRTYGELSGRRRDGLDGPRLAPGITLLGTQLKSGGTGIDLTASRHAIYYSQDFALADDEQSRKRVHRPGQNRRVTYTHLLAENTVDRAIFGALNKRRDVVASVLASIKEQQKP